LHQVPFFDRGKKLPEPAPTPDGCYQGTAQERPVRSRLSPPAESLQTFGSQPDRPRDAAPRCGRASHWPHQDPIRRGIEVPAFNQRTVVGILDPSTARAAARSTFAPAKPSSSAEVGPGWRLRAEGPLCLARWVPIPVTFHALESPDSLYAPLVRQRCPSAFGGRRLPRSKQYSWPQLHGTGPVGLAKAGWSPHGRRRAK
jgi:hypothetical protein